MAADSRSFKDRLDQLGCPYVEGVEEAWLNELLFKPGDFRIRLLQWLFSRFDSSLEEMLDSRHANLNVKMDSRIQRLLYVASSFGLCRPDDADLVRGVAQINKQVLFLDQIIDLVCIMDAADDPQTKALNSTAGHVSSSTPLQEQFQHDCWYADTIAAQEKMDSMFSSTAKLFPPDINKILEKAREDKGCDRSDRYLLPDFERMAENANQLERDLRKQHEILQELLKQKNEEEIPEPGSGEKAMKKLQLVLSELSQLIVGFTYCYENEMSQWCNKTPPQLTPLGPAFKRIHNLLKQFVRLLQSIASIRSSHSRLHNNIKEKVLAITEKDTTPGNLGHAGAATLESVQRCIMTLEESLNRHDRTVSRSANTTVNMTLIQVE